MTATRASGRRPVPLRAALAAAWILAAVAGGAWGVGPLPARAAAAQLTASELDLKAAYVLGFMRYVRIVNPAPDAATRPLTVAVLGDDAFAAAMRRAAQGKHVDGREVAVAALGAPDSVRRYDVVYVGLPASAGTGRVLDRLRGAPVLTVGESEDFVDRGGMIELFLDDRKLRFAVNADAATRAGLRVSATLLSLAAEVRGRGH